MKRNKKLRAEAEGAAKKIIRKAEIDAAKLREEGFQDGLSMGALHAFEVITEYLSMMDEELSRFRQKVGADVAKSLGEAFSDDEIVRRFCHAWDENLQFGAGVINVYVCEEYRGMSQKLHVALAARSGREIVFGRGCEGKMVMECDDRIFTMDLKMLTENAVTQFVLNTGEQFSGLVLRRDELKFKVTEFLNRLTGEKKNEN